MNIKRFEEICSKTTILETKEMALEIRDLKIKDTAKRTIEEIISRNWALSEDDYLLYDMAKRYERAMQPIPFPILRYKIKKFKFRDDRFAINNFTYLDVINKFGQKPQCYLTGRFIDYNINDYSLDHIIPVSRGGTNELDNLGICDMKANMIKSDLSLSQTIDLSIKILKRFGYEISGPEPFDYQ